MKFGREERYIFVKIKDARVIESNRGRGNGEQALREFLMQWRIPTREGLVVEKDWPEYEPTWAAIERHVTGAPAWVGIGPPPVGTVCGYQHTHHKGAWYDGEILYISDEYTIVKGHPVGEQHYYTRNLNFRPIRTPEQIAAEERDQAIQDLYFTVNWSEGRDTWPLISKARKEDYAKAIDAGYRKQDAK